MKFEIVIDDKAGLLGLAAAREAYNANLPDAHDGKGAIINPKPGVIDTDQGYLQMIADSAVASYAKQHGTDVGEIDAKISELQVKRAEIVAKGQDSAKPSP